MRLKIDRGDEIGIIADTLDALQMTSEHCYQQHEKIADGDLNPI